ncbi:MAG: hypothetical protein U1E76_13550 [Planctomycetota bacterium]
MVALILWTALAIQSACEKDVRHAVAEIGKQCARLIEAKQIDWARVSREFLAQARPSRPTSSTCGCWCGCWRGCAMAMRG